MSTHTLDVNSLRRVQNRALKMSSSFLRWAVESVLHPPALSGSYHLRQLKVIRFSRCGWCALKHPTAARYMHGTGLLEHGGWVHYTVRGVMHNLRSCSLRLVHAAGLRVSALQTVHERILFVRHAFAGLTPAVQLGQEIQWEDNRLSHARIVRWCTKEIVLVVV
jgi:hypothetical protein